MPGRSVGRSVPRRKGLSGKWKKGERRAGLLLPAYLPQKEEGGSALATLRAGGKKAVGDICCFRFGAAAAAKPGERKSGGPNEPGWSKDRRGAGIESCLLVQYERPVRKKRILLRFKEASFVCKVAFQFRSLGLRACARRWRRPDGRTMETTAKIEFFENRVMLC